MFTQNTYTANFYTNGQSLVHLEGAPRVFFSGETFTNNGDMANDAITLYGTGILVAQSGGITIADAINSPSSYPSSTLGQSLITVKRSVQVEWGGPMTFTNNWKIETDYSSSRY
jgi:hypothetical protein